MGAGRLPFWVILINKSAFQKKNLPLKVLFYRGRAENRTFRPPETNKQKKRILNFKWL